MVYENLNYYVKSVCVDVRCAYRGWGYEISARSHLWLSCTNL